MFETAGGEAEAALQCLDAALERSIVDLSAARARIAELLAARAAGKSWRDIVADEQPPLVVESVSSVLDNLSVTGSRFRRAEAQALYSEGLSMEQVASLFGVTRQRVSALLRDRAAS